MFEWQPPSPPDVRLMAELMLEPARARAQAALARGDAMGRMADLIGQGGAAIASAPQRMQIQAADRQRQAVADQSAQLSLEEKQASIRTAQKLGARLPSWLNDDGTYNTAQIYKDAQGDPDIAQHLFDLMTTATTTNGLVAKQRQARADSEKDRVGRAALGAVISAQTARRDTTFDDFMMNIYPDVKAGLVSPQTIAELAQRWTKPDNALATSLITQSEWATKEWDARQQRQNTLKPEPSVVYKGPDGSEHPVFATNDGHYVVRQGQDLIDVTDKVTRPGSSKSSILNGLSGDLKTRVEMVLGKKGITPSTATDEDVRAILPAASEAAEKALANKDRNVQITIDSKSGGAPRGDFAKTGDAFLQTIPPQWRRTVEKVGNYQEDPSKVTTFRSGMREQLMQWVNQYNPEYDQSQFTRRSPMAKAFTSGQQAQAINSLNTAILHLDQFGTVIDALNNRKFVPGNAAYNWFRTTFGDKAPTNFDGMKTILSGELAAAFKKSGATDAEIAHVTAALDAAKSPDQLRGFIQDVAIPALGGKIATYNDQYRQVMGDNDPFKVVLPAAEEVLKKHGLDPNHPTIGTDRTTPANSGPQGFSVTAPNGKTYVFRSRADLDAFKAKAGLK